MTNDTQTPNQENDQCTDCKYRQYAVELLSGHCYMFEDAPKGRCGQWRARKEPVSPEPQKNGVRVIKRR